MYKADANIRNFSPSTNFLFALCFLSENRRVSAKLQGLSRAGHHVVTSREIGGWRGTAVTYGNFSLSWPCSCMEEGEQQRLQSWSSNGPTCWDGSELSGPEDNSKQVWPISMPAQTQSRPCRGGSRSLQLAQFFFRISLHSFFAGHEEHQLALISYN